MPAAAAEEGDLETLLCANGSHAAKALPALTHQSSPYSKRNIFWTGHLNQLATKVR